MIYDGICVDFYTGLIATTAHVTELAFVATSGFDEITDWLISLMPFEILLLENDGIENCCPNTYQGLPGVMAFSFGGLT